MTQKQSIPIDAIARPLGAVALLPALYLGNPTLALLLGMSVALVLDREPLAQGSRLGALALQSAIVLLGFRLDMGDMLALTADYVLIVGGYVLLTLILAWRLGKLMGCDRVGQQLVASGTAICGGTAIATLSPIVRAPAAQTGVALALVFILNAIALLTLPWIGEWLEMSQKQFGVWVALAVHDTSSVIATASAYGEESAAVAMTLKLGRTLWLIPLIILFSMRERTQEVRVRIPLFVVLFVMASVCGSVLPIPIGFKAVTATICQWVLVLALFFVGASMTRQTLRDLRGRTVGLGLLLWFIVLPATWFVATQWA